MDFRIGEIYRDRKGVEWRVVYFNPYNDEFPIVGVSPANGQIMSWRADGGYGQNPDQRNDRDLVSGRVHMPRPQMANLAPKQQPVEEPLGVA